MTETTELLIDSKLISLISPHQAWYYKIVPYKIEDVKIVFYAGNNFSNEMKDEVEFFLEKEIQLDFIEEDILEKYLNKYFRKNNYHDTQNSSEIFSQNSDDYIFQLIREAKDLHSSDIHLEPCKDKGRIRFRIDGTLIEGYRIDKETYPSVVNKIKIKANLDISEKRLPQDGRILFENRNENFDVRVSIIPAYFGEKIVLRILNKSTENVDLQLLGFRSNELENYYMALKKTQGIILITGPTGSGKTTTLYATLKILNQEKNNILTIEDPIEYTMEGINQVQLKENLGLSFSTALRAFLRQDPDIIMIGEIRDEETAQIAIRAALTGHLVLSTLHTQSAWGAISRLTEMNIPSYLIAATLNLTAAQRLIKKLCPICKKEVVFDKNLLPEKFIHHKTLLTHFMAKGCGECYYTGYKGRIGIFEVIPIDKELTGMIKINTTQINDILKNKNINTLALNAYEIFLRGETTLEEIYPMIMQ